MKKIEMDPSKRYDMRLYDKDTKPQPCYGPIFKESIVKVKELNIGQNFIAILIERNNGREELYAGNFILELKEVI